MSLERIVCVDRDDWLSQRMNGIGGSEAAAAVGMSPWQTPMELWRIKTGKEGAKDISDNAAVQLGVQMEPALRSFFAAKHPELTVDYRQFDMLYQPERPWLYATLDGELAKREVFVGGENNHFVQETVKHGILEIKTATPNGKVGWEKWSNGQIPTNYLCQLYHQLLATGYAFAYLFAALYSMNGDITLREYEIQRADVEDDLAWLLDKETEFWGRVQRNELPPMPLTI